MTVEEDQEGYVSLVAHPCRETLEKHGLLGGDYSLMDTLHDSAHSDSDPELTPSPSKTSKDR